MHWLSGRLGHIILYSEVEPVSYGQQVIQFDFQSFTTASLSEAEQLVVAPFASKVKSTPEILFKNVTQRKQPYLVFSFVPLVKEGGEIKKIVSFNLNKTYGARPAVRKNGRSFTTSSVLASGEWYKVGITRNGVYRIDYNFLESLGVDMSTLNPQHVNVYGNVRESFQRIMQISGTMTFRRMRWLLLAMKLMDHLMLRTTCCFMVVDLTPSGKMVQNLSM